MQSTANQHAISDRPRGPYSRRLDRRAPCVAHRRHDPLPARSGHRFDVTAVGTGQSARRHPWKHRLLLYPSRGSACGVAAGAGPASARRRRSRGRAGARSGACGVAGLDESRNTEDADLELLLRTVAEVQHDDDVRLCERWADVCREACVAPSTALAPGAIRRSFVSIRGVVEVSLDGGLCATEPTGDLGDREALLVAVVASERRRPPPLHDTGLDGHQR